MTIPELTAEIERLTAAWNGIDQKPAMRIRSLCRQRAEELVRLGGCCGEQMRRTVEVYGEHGQYLETREWVLCPWLSWEGDCECPAAKRGAGFPQLATVLNLIDEIERSTI